MILATLLMGLGTGSVAMLGTGCPAPRDMQRSQTHVDLAKDLLGKGQDTAAETEVKKAITFDAHNEEAFLVFGLVYLVRAAHTENLVERENCLSGAEAEGLRKDSDEFMRTAAKHFERATQLAPDYGEAWMDRAVVAMHFRDWDQAIDLLERSLANAARLQSEALARTNLGWALHNKQNSARATTELLQAEQLTPNLCLAHFRLARVLYDRDRFEEAAAELAPFQSATPAEGAPVAAPACAAVLEALYLGGQARLRNHEIQAAVPWFMQCVEAAPRSCVAKQCETALSELGAGP
jgi:Tfp pilus assembly protein PilF